MSLFQQNNQALKHGSRMSVLGQRGHLYKEDNYQGNIIAVAR